MPFEEGLLALALAGLSIGDAFGQSLFSPQARAMIERHELPPAPWRWTDDTQMALSVVEELTMRNWIDQDSLARRMAWRYSTDPARGYGSGTRQTLERIAQGEYFRSVARAAYNGGSFGSGSAARAVPIGAYFANFPHKAAREARLAAGITHLHPEGQAGAEAVAVAASVAASGKHRKGVEFLKEIIQHIPESQTRQKIAASVEIPPENLSQAVETLGVGENYTILETVPYCLWCAAHHMDDFEEALWWTISGMGNRDTNCAIVGGIVALAVRRLPEEWLRRREPLPSSLKMDLAVKQSYTKSAPPPAVPVKTGLDYKEKERGQATIRIDALTGLPNLMGLLSFAHLLEEAEPFTPFSLVAIHLNSLPEVNRSMGRTAGDELLRSCASALQSSGIGTVFRTGGDKFGVILENSGQALTAGEIGRLAETVQANKPARIAVIHFGLKELATPGNLLACLFAALGEQHYIDYDGKPLYFDATAIRASNDFPWMILDLADQIQRMSDTADEIFWLAYTDIISQLPNMRAALGVLDRMLRQAQAAQQPFSVLMIDGDNLRRFNEVSYEAGDEAIRLMGSVLKSQLRDSDFLARWRTGDEFLILLPDTDRDQALLVGNRLCQTVAHTSRTTPSWLFPVTISVGIAAYPDHGTTEQNLVSAAEKGLELAKQSGKNQVRFGVN